MLPRFLCPVPVSVYDLVGRIILQEQNKDYETPKSLLVSLLHCLYEAEDPSLCQFVAELLNAELVLSYTTLSPLDCLSLGYFLSVISTTTSGMFRVNLMSCSIGDQGCKFLTRGLCKCLNTHSTVTSQLTMYLSFNDIHEEGAHHIAELLTNFVVVDLWSNPIGADGLKSLCVALVTNTSLTNLILNSCSIVVSEDNGPALTEMLTRNNTLKYLSLGDNRLTESGCHYISSGLRKSTSLRELKLYYCKLTDQGVEILSTGLNNYIEVLDLYGNNKITGLKNITSNLITPARLIKVCIPYHLKSSINSIFGPVNEVRLRNGLPKIDVQGEWLFCMLVCTLY